MTNAPLKSSPKRSYSLAVRIATVFVTFAALLLIPIGVLLYRSGRSAIESAAMAELVGLAHEKEADIRAWGQERLNAVAGIAGTEELRGAVAALLAAGEEPAARDKAREALTVQLRLRKREGFLDLFVLDTKTGTIQATTNDNEAGASKADRPYFQRGQEGPYLQSPYFLHETDIEPIMTASAPIMGPDGAVQAVLATRMELSGIKVIAQRRSSFRETVEAYVVDDNRRFVTPPPFSPNLRVLRDKAEAEAAERLARKESGVMLAPDYQHKPAIIVYRWIADMKLGLVVKMEQSEAFAPVRSFSAKFVFVSLLALPISCALAIWLARTLAQPVFRLQEGARKLAKGERNLRLPVTSSDEVGRLTEMFNEMADAISRKDRELSEHRDSLEAAIEARTQRLKEVAEERRVGEEALQSILDHSLDLICTIDAAGRFTKVSPSCEAILGYRPEELIGRAYMDLVEQADHERTTQAAVDVMSGIPTRAFENRYIRKDGRVVPFSWTANWSEKSRTMFAIARDISIQKAVESELQNAKDTAEAASRAKGQFLANMSHEIRTPMNGIIGMTELALETPLTREQREYLRTVRESARSLLGLINDILDFSKIEAGHLSLEEIDFAPRDSVALALKPLAVRADHKGLELAVRFESDVPMRLVGDPTRLRQVITNLVDNAIKFTDRGEVVLSVAVEEFGLGSVMLRFAVKDSGIGIDASKQERIFDAFVQADGTTTRTHGGTGLGLSICARLVEQMHGKIGVESVLGEGTTFHFTAKFSASDRVSEEAEAGILDLAGLRVLVADDSLTVREILRAMLESWRMHPQMVDSGSTAIAEIRRAAECGQGYRIALIDAAMNGMDGFAVVEQLQGLRDGMEIIMMLSSAKRVGDVSRCDALGVHGVIVKPVSHSDLLDAIFVALGKESLDQTLTVESDPDHTSALRILLAEDNDVNQAVVTGLLEKRGHIVVPATDGREAVELALSQEFDVILMDVQMPELDGFEVTAAIREYERKTGRGTPIIAMTAHAMAGDRERCLQAGMDDYIAKPVRKEDLLNAIAQISNWAAALHHSESSTKVDFGLGSRAELLKSFDDDESLLKRIVRAFLSSTPPLLERLSVAVQNRDEKDIEYCAHTLAGALGPFGVAETRAMFKKLERDARSKDLTECDSLLHELTKRTTAISRSLEDLCAAG